MAKLTIEFEYDDSLIEFLEKMKVKTDDTFMTDDELQTANVSLALAGSPVSIKKNTWGSLYISQEAE